jgi:hypothetical protein
VNSRLAHWFVRLYPRPWRERYGEEFEALLQTSRGGLRASANVICSVLHEHLSSTSGFEGEQGSFQSWCIRAPWAIFGVAPLFLLAGAYFVACLILWSGWKIFLPGTDMPFVQVDGLAILYFGLGRGLYFGAPILIGWGIAIAAHQRIRAVWPAIGLVLIALMGGTAHVHAGRTAVPRGLGHISMDFAFGPSVRGIPDGLLRALLIFALTLLPWIIWRLQRALST